MKCGTMLAGVALAAIGAGIGVFVPPVLQEASEARAKIPLLNGEAKAGAKVGDKFLVHGTVGKGNKPVEKGMVAGTKSVWGVSDSEEERKEYWEEVDAGTPKDKRLDWHAVQTFNPTVALDLPEVGTLELTLANHIVSGQPATEEEVVGPEKFKWEGVRPGDEVTAFVVVTGLEPLEVETQMGDFLYAGPPEALKAQQAKSDKFVVYAMYGMGGLFGFFGLVTIVGGLFGKKQQQ